MDVAHCASQWLAACMPLTWQSSHAHERVWLMRALRCVHRSRRWRRACRTSQYQPPPCCARRTIAQRCTHRADHVCAAQVPVQCGQPKVERCSVQTQSQNPSVVTTCCATCARTNGAAMHGRATLPKSDGRSMGLRRPKRFRVQLQQSCQRARPSAVRLARRFAAGEAALPALRSRAEH